MNVFGSTSRNTEKKFETSIFGQKPYHKTLYIESNREKDPNMKIISSELQTYLIQLVSEKQLQKLISIMNLTIQV